VALGSSLSIYLGLVLAALVVRYGKEPAAWEYSCSFALALAVVAWSIATGSETSPRLGAIPLMLPYVFDYLDERGQNRTAAAAATVTVGASHGGRPAEPSAQPNGSAAARPGTSGVAAGPHR
jgi:hypothetical protein